MILYSGMKRIEKKVQSQYFESILNGQKRYEIRLADFDYEAGDTLVLKEQKDGTQELTGRELETEILQHINTKEAEKFWPKEDIEKYGLLVLSLRRKYNYD